MASRSAAAEEHAGYVLSRDDGGTKIHLIAELEAQQVLSNVIRYGKGQPSFAYQNEGGQDVAFFFQRYSAEIELFDQHSFILLYQPLTFRSRQVAQRDLQFSGVIFSKGTPLDILYGFDFFRLAYQYDFFENQRHELAIGASLQIRNAQVGFSSVDGKTIFTNDDLGPVPLLRVRGKYGWESGWFVGGEVDGIYAPIAGLNGGTEKVVGALADVSLRAGMALKKGAECFLNVRYFFGGFEGPVTGIPPLFGTDTDSATWLHTVSVSLGFRLT